MESLQRIADVIALQNALMRAEHWLVAELLVPSTLFQAAAAQDQDAVSSALETALRDLNPDAMTPKEAIEALYRLRALLDDDA